MLTHKFCINNSEKYCFVFNILKIGQSLEYTIYGKVGETIVGSLKQCPKSILEIIFFDTNLEEKKKEIGDSSAEYYFFDLFKKPVLEYCEKEITNKEIIDGANPEKIKRLIRLGLVECNLSNLNPKFYFISEDTYSK